MREGVPDELVGELNDRVWSRTVERESVAAMGASHRVLSTQLHAGLTRVRIFSDAAPGEGFEHTPAELEDVYFSELSRARSATA